MFTKAVLHFKQASNRLIERLKRLISSKGVRANKLVFLGAAVLIVLFLVVAMAALLSHHKVSQKHNQAPVLSHYGVSHTHTVGMQKDGEDNKASAQKVLNALHQLANRLSFSVDEVKRQLSSRLEDIKKANESISSALSSNDQNLQAFQRETTESISNVKAQMVAMNAHLSKQIALLSNQFTQILKAQQESKKELTADQLPFKPLSVDWWNGEPKLRVQASKTGDYQLLGVGDSLKGWMLKKIITGKPNTLIFTNARSQIIRVAV